MRILVTVRAVPSTDSSFAPSTDGLFYEEEGLSWQVNEYDLYAMEQAVRLKERLSDVEIVAVSVGPSWWEPHLRKAMSLGADRGLRIDDSAFRCRDALQIAMAIAAFAREGGFDLALSGMMSQDLMRGAVGPMLAELLGFRSATAVVSLTVENRVVLCERELAGGSREKVSLRLPAALTIQTGINVPRYASLSNVLRVKGLEIPCLPLPEETGKARSERICKVYRPERSGDCRFIEGGLEEVADELIHLLRERTGQP